MEEFLRERGLQESVIEKFQCDGIDATVITLMTDEELKHYLPRFGDQIAIKAFARQELQKSQNTESDKRRSLREKLISKLQKKHSSSEHLKRSESQRGNVNAKKMSRKIELGWLHQYGFNGSLKQVRSASGGGTRTVAIQLDCLIGDVLPVAKDLFFPDGISKKGTVDEFDFHIADQTQTRLSPHLKIQELYERTKLKRVRLYMVTCSPGFFSSDGTEAADNETRAGTNETRAGTVDQVDSLVGEMQEKNDKRVETAEKETTRRSVEQVDSMVTELQGKNDKHVEAAENETTRRSVELVDSVLGKLEERNDECVETTGNETTRSTVEQVGSMVTELHEMNDKHVEAADDMHILDEHGETFSNGSVQSRVRWNHY
ncbi:uncharacterized protein LOC123546442 [Mercenaria mercenaria]|uniref:uncharacterized protein LOC123546442 n=1 Tax=Mercenaria mercenaria TaxID=6596 RepID=UPI00234F65B9|nr:uncharacterized protein LOC123546442 [Mercenaria mercenaria]